MTPSDEIRSLERALAAGRLSRREFIRRAVALGLSASAIAAALAACGTTAPPTSPPAGQTTTAATTGTTTAGTTTTTTTTAAASRPPAGTPAASAGPTRRGGGGTLRLLQWQAPTILNPHLSSGTTSTLASRIVYEPLVTINNESQFVPVLAESVPSRENGGLAADLRSVTWKLKSGLKWSDGQPVVADDVVSTWEYVTDPATAATTITTYENVERVERVDDLTVRFTFKEPTLAWFRAAQASVLPKHKFAQDKGAPARNSPNNLAPVGTGPYKVTEFKPNDIVFYAINENYREPTKPAFDRIELKGGGNADGAARAVLQTGDFDYAWNMQVTDQVLRQFEQGGKGVAEFQSGRGIERNLINFTDPNKEVDGERSSLKAPHPFFTDLKVRQAFALGCDRNTIVSALYGRGGEVAVNVLNIPPQYRSDNNKAEFSVEKANQLLDEAGWRRGAGGYREKGGVAMSILYQTSVTSLRQKTQEIIKDAWEKMGVKVELKSIDAGIFFGSDPGNPDNTSHFYADVEMYTSNQEFDPQTYMRAFHSAYVSQKANLWSGGNNCRYVNPEYDKLWDAARTETDAQKRAQLFIQMNDIVVQNVVHIPLVTRRTVFARAKNLQGMNYTPWDEEYWNIANWVRA